MRHRRFAQTLFAGFALAGAAAFDACASATSRVAAGPSADSPPADTVYEEKDVENPAFQLYDYGVPRIPYDVDLTTTPKKVLVSFVIDTTGRALDKTFKVIQSDHPSLTRAVWEALPKMRFIPARLKTGRAVKQMVQVPFEFFLR
jgi:TonB family protein